MTNKVKAGTTLDYTNGTGSTITAGTPVLMNDCLGFAVADIANGASGPVDLDPNAEWQVTAATGAWSQGEDIYFDGTSFTTKVTGGTLVGVASRAKTTAATTGYVRIGVHS